MAHRIAIDLSCPATRLMGEGWALLHCGACRWKAFRFPAFLYLDLQSPEGFQ